MSLPKELLKKVKLIDLQTRRMVNNVLAGEYKSALKGQGMTFSEFRECVPGDDVRTISWPLTARTGKTYIKKYDEERELTIMLAVDVSGSTEIGGGEYFKGEKLAHLAALIGFSAAKNNDQIGLLLFSDVVEHYVPPKKGRAHVMRMVRDMLAFEPMHRRTDMRAVIEHIQGTLKRRGYVFLLSDFLVDDFEAELRGLARRHEVVAVRVSDQIEFALPNVGLLDLVDLESGENLTLDTQQMQSSEIQALIASEEDRLSKTFKRCQVDEVLVSETDYAQPLIRYFQKRRKAR